MKYFDAHTHVQFDAFDADREAVISHMQEAEVNALVVGVDFVSSQKAVALAEKHPHLFAAVGLHPNDTHEKEFSVEAFEKLALHEKVRALGECGLDNFRPVHPEETKKKQQEVLRAHVELALRVDKPLMIHARPSKGTMDAYHELLSILKPYKKAYGEKLRGDIHFFVGGMAEAREFIALGFTLSFTAVLTFTHDYDEVVHALPLASILTETDAPYIAPEGRRGKRNDPLAVVDVAEAIARIRGEDREIVRTTLLANAQRLLGF